eukprot:c22318_g2_i1 orf=185-1336(-)
MAVDNSAVPSMAGKTITCRAAVAWEPKKPLVIEEVQVEPPQAGEVRVRIKNASLCHSDIFFLELEQGIFPRILGHEAAGIVESVGEGVTDVKEGDHVIPLFNGECGECQYCKSSKTNLCREFRVNPAKCVMLRDQRTRFYKDGKPIYHFLSTSAFSEYTVVDRANVAKVNPEAPLENICLLSCGIPTGVGAVWNAAKVEKGSTVAIFGLGTVGLAVAEGARIAGASRIIGVDVNPKKFLIAKQFGVTEFINPRDYQMPIQQVLQEHTDGGVDYCFECVGQVDLMKSAFECTHDGWGKAILVGIESLLSVLSFNPMQFFDGRQISGTTFGDFKGKTHLPHLVDMYLRKELKVDEYITHRLPFTKINEAIRLLKEGESLRCVLDL